MNYPNPRPDLEYVLYRDDSVQRLWRWRLMLDQTQNIANAGQGFETKQECLAEIEIVKVSYDAEVTDYADILDAMRDKGE